MRLVCALVVATTIGTAAAPIARADEAARLYPLVDTAAQRLLTADPVAAAKWVSGGSITDAARVGQVLDVVGADATARGIDPVYVRRAFTDQVHATEGVEYVLFGHWKLEPADAPATAPNLSESRTTIDGFNATMVAQMAEQWGVLRGPDCRAALDDARAAVTIDRGLDALHADGLTAATRSYCAQST